MKLKFSLHIVENYSGIKFHENPSNWSREHVYAVGKGRTCNGKRGDA